MNGFSEYDQLIRLGPNGTSLDLLRAVYRNPDIPLAVRIRAAGLAIKYEHPALQVVAQISEQGFAELLERRLKHLAPIIRESWRLAM